MGSPVDDALDRLDYWDTIEAALTTIPESSPYRETALRSLDHLKERVLTNHATVREALERLRRHPDAWSQEAFDQQKARADAAEAEAQRLTEGLRKFIAFQAAGYTAGGAYEETYALLVKDARALIAASPSGGGGAK